MKRGGCPVEAWRRSWEASPEGKATLAMYAAAEKAGMAEELRKCCAEVCVSEYGGKVTAYCYWEAELTERPEFVFPKAAFERAEAWLRKYGTAKGWEVR